jgi:type IV secretion system protein TrbL
MPDCGLNPVCQGGSVLGDAVGGVAGNAIDALADEVTEAVGKAVASVGTLWVKIGTPNLTTSNGGTTPSNSVGFLQGSLWWYMAAAAVLSVIIAGAKMAWEGRAEPGRELLKSLMTLVVVAGAGLTAISLAVAAADGFAKWIIDSSLEGGDFGENITRLLGLGGITGLGAIIVIILGLAAFVASLVQIALMVVRGGMLVILAGILPMSAAATNTEWGRTWFKKCIAWLVAFILYKPAAAIVYATAFKLASSDVFGGGDDLLSAITGVVLMVLALLALPALMRFVTPMVGAMASAGSGAGGAMAAGAIAAMPAGAMRMPRGGGSGAVAGSSGRSGPSGAGGSGGGRGPAGSNDSRPPGGGSKPENGAPPAPAGASDGGGATGGGTTTGADRTAGSGGAAAGGAAAGVGAGPAAAGAAAAASKARNVAQGATESQTGDGSSSGSR